MSLRHRARHDRRFRRHRRCGLPRLRRRAGRRQGQHHRQIRSSAPSARLLTRLARFFPPDAPAWDDSSNNKWLVSGRGALIMNPPSAWAVAKRDAPQVAEQLWTHGMPSGPKGRYAPFVPYFWGIWNFGKNKSAAKSLLVHLSQRASAEKMVTASGGYDLPSFAKFTDFNAWAEEGPPKGTLTIIPTPTITRSCRWLPRRRRRRSRCRSTRRGS